jgi:hypothetical protein
MPVTDGSDDCRCHDRADPGNLADTGTPSIAGRDPFQLIVQFFALLLNQLPLTQSMSIRFRMCGVRSASVFSRMSAMAVLSFAGFCAYTVPVRAEMLAAG